MDIGIPYQELVNLLGQGYVNNVALIREHHELPQTEEGRIKLAVLALSMTIAEVIDANNDRVRDTLIARGVLPDASLE